MVRILEERDFPVRELVLLASERGAGEELVWKGGIARVVALGEAVPEVDLAFFSAGAGLSRQVAPKFVDRGAIVIDNSSAWRMDSDVPLVVPEVNPEAAITVFGSACRGIIANPNCSTIQLVVALKPLVHFGLERVIVSTYQSVSGAGQKGMAELSEQVTALFNSREPIVSVMPHPIAFNCIPAIGSFLENGYTDEEWKLVEESRKILGLPALRVSPTAVRVPVFSSHSEAVHVELGRKVSVKEAKAAFHNAEGIVVQDRPAEDHYPMPSVAAGTDSVYVGRIRQDPDDDCSLNFWVVADNLRKGAALNAIQIAEILDEHLEEA
jgi:aspartate-semialdehyde dehydrogenase